jgi:hypothetical protein
MIKNIQVQKNDGTYEDFQIKKIIDIATGADLTKKQNILLAKKINIWIKNIKKPIISSYEIRNKMKDELRILNPAAAELYQWYESIKNNKI